ncbi:MAG TPA: hypothetical protein VFA26_00765, partial [Gemmataceae bacterium]|nr:hypothetical protein [Gemmataceae bacterium]
MATLPADNQGAGGVPPDPGPPPARKRRGWLWAAAVAAVALLAAGGAAAVYFGRPRSVRPPDPVTPPPAGDTADRVHAFCGACHLYPPADTFPREHWKAEVERGYSFFSEASMNLQAPPIDDVIRYYEERAPEAMTLPELPRAARPLRVRFERRDFAGPPGNIAPALANVNLVHLFDDKRLDVLACEMRYG